MNEHRSYESFPDFARRMGWNDPSEDEDEIDDGDEYFDQDEAIQTLLLAMKRIADKLLLYRRALRRQAVMTLEWKSNLMLECGHPFWETLSGHAKHLRRSLETEEESTK